MRVITLISDDPGLAETIGRHLPADLQLETAAGIDEAMGRASWPPALVITPLAAALAHDCRIPARIDAAEARVPVLVAADEAPREAADLLAQYAVFDFIAPSAPAAALQEAIVTLLESSVHGHISGVSLASFLQLVELDHKTCSLRIRQGEKRGVLYFRDGELLDAVCLPLLGEEAALTIVGWAPVTIDLCAHCPRTEPAIDSPLGYILIEGARRQDEEKEKEESAASEPVPEPASPPPPTPEAPAASAASPADDPLTTALLDALEEEGISALALIRPEDGAALTRELAPEAIETARLLVDGALELGRDLDYGPPERVVIETSGGDRLLALAGPAVQLFARLGDDHAPAPLAAALSPIIKRMTRP